MLTNAILVLSGIAFGAGATWVLRPSASTKNESVSALTHSELDTRQGESVRTTSALRKAAGSPQPAAIEFLELNSTGEIESALALALAAGMASEKEKLAHYRKIFKTWAETDPEGALFYAKSSFPAGLMQSETIGIALNIWGARDPRSAWNWAEENLDGTLRDRAQNDVIIGWTRKSPATAATWLTSSSSSSQPLHAAVARTWAERDPAAALAWAGQIQNEKLRSSTEKLVATLWASDQPSRAAQLIASRPDLAAAIVRGAGPVEPVLISKVVATMPNSPAKTEATNELVSTWTATQPDTAFSWALKIQDPEARRQAIAQIGTTWGATDPGAALVELQKLPDADTADAIIGAFNSWAATDPVGLQQYVTENPNPMPGMDQARLSLADMYSDTDVAASLNLSLGLSSPVGREDAIAHYYRHWRKVDDASAQDWLSQTWNTLAPSVQNRLGQEQNRTIAPR